MEWTRPIDGYCERIDASYWSEPVNAVTNLAFVLVALYMWRRCDGLAGGRWLSGVLLAIGVGSYLFHTHATPWAALVDVAPIAVFVLSFLYLANRDFFRWGRWRSIGGMLAFFPYAAAVAPMIAQLPFFNISAAYWVLPPLIFGYAVALRRTNRNTALGLALGGGVLCLSLLFRSVDEVFCQNWPLGTHFVWHILNGVMLGWMIEVWRRHKASAV